MENNKMLNNYQEFYKKIILDICKAFNQENIDFNINYNKKNHEYIIDAFHKNGEVVVIFNFININKGE